MSPHRSESGFTLLETIVVLAIIAVVSAIAVPTFGNSLAYFRVSGDARNVSNAVAVAKMRAASNFTRVRLFVDLDGGTHQIQIWDKTSTTCCWIAEGGATHLSSGVSFGFAPVGEAPPATQTTIDQAEACNDDDGNPIGNTACVMFNSRGVPIDASFASTGSDALYVTDDTEAYGITIAATGMIRNWRTKPVATPSWTLK